MYIEGNALILGDSSYLEHHGILGQKWGIRRFQNKDGTRTAAGKARDQKNAAKSVVLSTRRTRNSWQYQNAFTKAQDKLTNDSKEAVRNMAVNALNGKRKAEYEAAVEEYDAAVNYRYDEYRKEELKYAAIAGMASGARYPMRYAGDNSQDDTLKWDAEFYMYDDGDQGKYNSYDYFLVAKGENPNNVCARAMNARNNIESIAEKDVDDILGDSKNQIIKGKVKDQTVGDELKYQITEMAISASDYTYVLEHGISYDDDEIKQMKADIKKYEKEVARLGLAHSALFIEDGTLYLSHHGIRGQRWGVRRFQNRDGSLTNAGRKRLGYATKGVTQTVGKAFKAGVKAGGNAVKAVKAHHEKKEAEKLEKKKEKASKTRLGVMANKDLFTNEEIRKLNERFKLEDEMKMATLQKGVEIAKAVGTIAQNVGTVAKTYEDVTGQSLSPIKRKAAEEKARQDKEDRERRIAREDADEARKAAKEERDIAIHEQTLRKAIASADTQEFTAQKTKAEADSSILDLYKKGQDFNGGSDATGQSWMEKATAGGKNPFFEEKLKNDPELAAAKQRHDEKAERKQHEQERDARIAAREKEASAKQSQPQQKQGGGDDDALFSQKGSLPLDKDRYRNNRAMEKAKQVKEDAAEERAKKQDEKAVNQTIDDTIEANRSFKETVRAQDPHAYDRGIAKDYIKGKLNNLPNTLADLNPINRAAKKIADKAAREEEAQVRKSMKDQYDQMVKNNGRDEANYVMYQTRVANLQQQGYSERKAKQLADSNPTFSAKRNRKVEYSQKVKDLDDTHRKNAKEIRKANKELTDYYYKLINGPGYDPGTPKREALDRKYKQKRGELERLDKDNNEMLEKGMKEAKKILEHSLTIQNGVLFIDSSDGFTHHGIRGQRWGVRRFQNADGTLTAAGKKRDARRLQKELNSNDKKWAWESRYASDRRKDYEAWDKAANKARSKGKIDKAEKYEKKRDQAAREREEHIKNANSLYDKNVDLMKEVSRKGYSGSAKATARQVNTGAEIVGMIALNVLASAAGSPVLVTRRKYVQGTKFKVKANNEVTHYAIQNGTLFINAGEPYLEHHGVKGMKWGKHLMAGKGVDAEGGGGGGFAEDDEKLKEMAKKAGMSVAEYRTKMVGKLSGVASKVGSTVKEKKRLLTQTSAEAKRVSIKDKHLVINGNRSSGTRGLAVGETGEKPKSFKEKAYNALGGKYKTQAAEAHREMVQKRNDADDKARRANAQGRAANANKKAGNVREYMANKEGARQLDKEAKDARVSQWEATEKANRAQWKYDHSIAGLYDKATGKYKQAHKRTKVPKTIDQAAYYYSEGPNSKLHNNRNSKAKTAKDQAKAAVWNAADHQIKAKEYRDEAGGYGFNTDAYGTAYMNASAKEARLAEGSYRRAAALGKQASRETSTSSRPRARKKKHTSGGSGVTVRRPGRKPVARTKRVTQSSTGVKRRGSTGSGRTVRRGA